ncbi:MAG: GNAT family N-acetyltransferase, partial [Bacillota bacterium]|nr:GNAT family N-acetyltransferase [Bacillota bacterium]
MDITIRNSRQEDFQDITVLFRQLWPGKELNTDDLSVVYNRGLSSVTDKYLSVEAEGRVIGFCAMSVVNNFWQAGHIAYVYAMIVDEPLRGRGIGRNILEKAFEIAKAEGCRKMELDSAFHRVKAHEFY